AEDDPVQRSVLDLALRNWGHEVVEAEDGERAWEIVRQGGVDVVVSDWEMPGLSGPDLCRRIREADLGHYVYVVLVTGRTGLDDVVDGIEAGADDFLTKPLRMTELRARLRAGARVLALEAALEARTAEAEQAAAVIQRDLDAAAALQRHLVPTEAVRLGSLRVEGALRPAATVAGDLFGAVPLDDEHLALYLLDVSGHGVPAAMLAVAVSRAITSPTASPLYDDTGAIRAPEAVLADLNDRFPTVDGEYLTMVVAVAHAPSGRVRFSQAGHPKPLLAPTTDGARAVGGAGLPLGLFPGSTYDAHEVTLAPGERLVLYSDGAPEAENASGEAFGPHRLAEAVTEAARTPGSGFVGALVSRLAAWRGGPFADDVSILALTRSRS
ncbi:MAG: SpoIIE family protein phosphatase, partial [Bacteroidota bacterium]